MDDRHDLPHGCCKWDEGRSAFLIHSGLIGPGKFKDADEVFMVANGRAAGDDDLLVVLTLLNSPEDKAALEAFMAGPAPNLEATRAEVDPRFDPLPAPAVDPKEAEALRRASPEIQLAAMERQREEMLIAAGETPWPKGRISISQFRKQGGTLLEGQTGVDLGRADRGKR